MCRDQNVNEPLIRPLKGKFVPCITPVTPHAAAAEQSLGRDSDIGREFLRFQQRTSKPGPRHCIVCSFLLGLLSTYRPIAWSGTRQLLGTFPQTTVTVTDTRPKYMVNVFPKDITPWSGQDSKCDKSMSFFTAGDVCLPTVLFCLQWIVRELENAGSNQMKNLIALNWQCERYCQCQANHCLAGMSDLTAIWARVTTNRTKLGLGLFNTSFCSFWLGVQNMASLLLDGDLDDV